MQFYSPPSDSTLKEKTGNIKDISPKLLISELVKVQFKNPFLSEILHYMCSLTSPYNPNGSPEVLVVGIGYLTKDNRKVDYQSVDNLYQGIYIVK